MRIHFATFVFSLLISLQSKAQSWEWALKWGNVKSDKAICIKTDDSGYIYVAGYFSNTVTLGTNLVVLNYTGSQSSKEAILAKFDSTGFCYWARSGGNGFDDRVLGMDVDKYGNSLIVGTYWSNNFNMGSQTINNTGFGGGDQCFVVKHDANGNLLWKTFVSSNGGDDQGLDAVTDDAGNSYIVGHMGGNTLYCGGNTLTATNTNTGWQKHSYWITKINSVGVFQWAHCFGNLPWDSTANKYKERDIAVCVDNAGGVYTTGGYDATYPFGSTTLTSAGGDDIFVMKYDTNGVFQWAKSGGSSKDDWANGICSDEDGHIYVVGEHRDSLIYDGLLIKNYDKRDAFIMKLDASNGNPIWGKRAGSDLGSERGNDVWADNQCNVYMTGDINEGAKFGDKITVPMGKKVEAFVARISPEGKWSWVMTGGGLDSNDRSNTIAKGKGSQLYVAGYFRSPSNYGPSNLTSSGSSDAFFARIKDNMLGISSKFEFTPPTLTNLCWGDTLKWTVPDHQSITITPTGGVSFNSDSTKLKFMPTVTTTYFVTGIGEGNCPEYDTISFTINVGQPPFQLYKPNDTILCTGESVTLAIASHDYLQVIPTTNATINSSQTQITFDPPVTTTYTVSGYRSGVCPSYDTSVFTIIHAVTPNANFELLPPYVLLDNPTFTFSNNSTGATKYRWYRNGNLFSISTYPTYTESQAGEFCYTLEAESNYGCIDTAIRCGDVITDERVFFPTAFTPNNDKHNDDFKPIILNINLANIKDYSFMVINRYGQQVYATKDPYFGWNGSVKDKPCDIGTYFYMCRFTTPEGKKYDIKGDVTLLK
jgi:gliding motility-associated-like protein